MADYQVQTGLPQLPSSGLDEKSFQLLSPVYQGMNGLARELSVQAGKVSYTQAEMANLNQLTPLLRSTNKLWIKALFDIPYGSPVHLVVQSSKICGFVTGHYAPAIVPYACHGLCNTVEGISAGNYGEVVFMRGFCAGLTGAAFMQKAWVIGSFLSSPTWYLNPTEAGCAFLGYGMGDAGFYLDISPI